MSDGSEYLDESVITNRDSIGQAAWSWYILGINAGNELAFTNDPPKGDELEEWVVEYLLENEANENIDIRYHRGENGHRSDPERGTMRAHNSPQEPPSAILKTAAKRLWRSFRG